MIWGILAGVISALLQSSGYVFSRAFLCRHHKPMLLTVYSQLVMGVFGVVMLGVSSFFVRFPADPLFYGSLGGWLGTFIIGQTSFFMALRDIEASRLSALLGLKIVALALITAAFGRYLSMVQWMAVVLCAVAAMGMNLTGGRLKRRGCAWLGLSVVSYAFCDIVSTELMLRMPGESMFRNSFGVVGLCYTLLGVLTAPALLKTRFRWGLVRDALPFAVAWFSSMVFLLTCFGLLGAVYGNIIQSSRGLISVLLGAALLYFGYEHLEPRVGRKAWVRRFLMAVVMLVAMALYSRAIAAAR